MGPYCNFCGERCFVPTTKDDVIKKDLKATCKEGIKFDLSKVLKCQGEQGCIATVTHIDNRGFIYCKEHGQRRKLSGRCRKMTAFELKILIDGKPLEKY